MKNTANIMRNFEAEYSRLRNYELEQTQSALGLIRLNGQSREERDGNTAGSTYWYGSFLSIVIPLGQFTIEGSC